ncbi:MAG: hypothetical protein JO251_05425 [Verrucomicrobia bacterium]|jgi:hypothetical protein|nr:hypothetical protein [Verrucomicrobiota bacterium]
MLWWQLSNLQQFVKIEVVILVIALLLSVAYRLATGSINTKGLLKAKTETGGISPARVQLLMLTGSVGLYYLLLVLQSLKTQNPPSKLPELPPELLFVLGGSHTLYLSSKAVSRARNKSAGPLEKPTFFQ